MESATAISELNWSIDGSMFSAAATQQDHHFAGLISAEEAHIMAQLFSASSYSDQEAMNTVGDRDSYYYCSDNSHSNLFNHVLDFEAFPWNDIMKNGVPMMSSSLSNISDNRNHCLEFHGLNNHNVDESVYPNKAISSDKSGEVHTTNQSETIISKHALQSKRKMQENSDLEITPIKRTEQQNCTTPNLEVERGDYPSDSPQKKSRLSGDGERAGKEIHLKKNQKHFRTNEGEENMGLNGQSSSSYGSEDDSLSSQEQNGTTSCGKGSAAPALNLNGKARAGRGSATDPQSLYARKRREKINERLRILQTLVPNGTKVDISTMLEEAVQYVKFLQMQIKLLSSDDLWMYAPIAYNGMDIGLDFKISPPS